MYRSSHACITWGWLYATLMLGAICTSDIQAAGAGGKEYQIKSAFLYNFLQFTEWPDTSTDANAPRQDKAARETIGIVGEASFKTFLEGVGQKKNFAVRVFETFNALQDTAQQQALWQCHLIFICESERAHRQQIIALARNHAVLTVSEGEDFLKQGGMITFLVEDGKVRFGINLVAVKQEHLRISSNVLRLARILIKE